MEKNSIILMIIMIVYLSFLFLVAHYAEKKQHTKWVNNPYIYSLSLAVYCSAWTYYGSIGVAADSGLNYLPIYLGPTIIAPVWIIILKKIIRISHINKVTNIADFISLRYGNDRFLGALVTLVCLVGIIPYLGLQLKAISETFHIVTKTNYSINFFEDNTTYITIIVALFASYYGTKYVDATEKRKGIITVVAIESVLKLLFFVIIGFYVTYFVFDGFDDIYQKAKTLSNFQEKNQIGGANNAMNWFFLMIMSMMAIFLLPRQFQVSVVENNRESHLKTASWLFPLYLLIFNLFVFPIAWGGNIIFEHQNLNADMFSILIPQHFNNQFITVLVFLGGFSASISMVIVSSISLSIMLTNNFLIPYNIIGNLNKEANLITNRSIVLTRKISIALLIFVSYLLYRWYGLDYHLVSIGMISFVIIAQLAPSFFGAIFWKRGTKKGAIAGMIVGLLICCFTLLVPYAIGFKGIDSSFVSDGLMGIKFLKPFQLFGLENLDPIPHALFWSLLFNVLFFTIVSINFKTNYRERNYAEMFVDNNKYNDENAYIWKGTAYRKDIETVLIKFLGAERTKRAMNIFNVKYNIDNDLALADARLIKFSENLLTGHIGTASAKILISSVVKEEKIPLSELMKILEESNENIITNKKLNETSNELKKISTQLTQANNALIEKDKQKDEFLDTVTHELRTPITAIRATSEILFEDQDLPIDLKQQFLKNIISESDRLNRLIDKILDLEKFETGTQVIYIQKNNFYHTIEKVLFSLQNLINSKHIKINHNFNQDLFFEYDEERITQVLTNLISNSIKFCPTENGVISIKCILNKDELTTIITDNGKGIEKSDLSLIFEKFYQSKNQNIKKPIGSGLGLAISKKIVEMHNGQIWANDCENGAELVFVIKKIGKIK